MIICIKLHIHYFGMSSLSIVCRRAHECFICVVCVIAYCDVLHGLIIWVTWLVSWKWKELHTLSEHMSSSVGHLCGLCCSSSYFVFFVRCFVCPMLPVSLDCPLLIAFSVFSKVYLITDYLRWGANARVLWYFCQEQKMTNDNWMEFYHDLEYW